MSKKNNLQKLLSETALFNEEESSNWTGDDEMLSLVVNDALKGVDIATRYPDFYQELLRDSSLRQAFLDILMIMEEEQAERLTELPEATTPNLSFLSQSANKDIRSVDRQYSWQLHWQRTAEQIFKMFSPFELEARSDTTLYEDSWIILLREDFQVGEAKFSVKLECDLPDDDVQFLATFIDIAVVFQGIDKTTLFPLRATLKWGTYLENLLITAEGRVKFPDVPISTSFDEILSGLEFTLEAVS